MGTLGISIAHRTSSVFSRLVLYLLDIHIALSISEAKLLRRRSRVLESKCKRPRMHLRPIPNVASFVTHRDEVGRALEAGEEFEVLLEETLPDDGDTKSRTCCRNALVSEVLCQPGLGEPGDRGLLASTSRLFGDVVCEVFSSECERSRLPLAVSLLTGR